jgi:hypothetical protein
MVVSETMTAARLLAVGDALKLEKLPTPKPGDIPTRSVAEISLGSRSFPRGVSAGADHPASATLRNALTSAPSSLPSMPQRIW